MLRSQLGGEAGGNNNVGTTSFSTGPQEWVEIEAKFILYPLVTDKVRRLNLCPNSCKSIFKEHTWFVSYVSFQVREAMFLFPFMSIYLSEAF